MSQSPAVSVLMPVYNAEQYVEKAVRSILAQSFTDFELVLVNDGSTDHSVEIIESIKDDRIRLLHQPENSGLARVRNRLLELARAPYIAWLDSDDYSEPNRLQLQYEYLEARPDVVLVGGNVRPFDSDTGKCGKPWIYPEVAEEARARLLFDDPFATSAVLVRTRVFRDDPPIDFRLDYPPAEDYDVWERVARKGAVVNLPRVLTHYRIHAGQASTAGKDREVASVRKIQARQLAAFGLTDITEDERELHLSFGMNRYGNGDTAADYRDRSEAWLLKLRAQNQSTGTYAAAAFDAVLADRWYRVCYADWKSGRAALQRYSASPIASWPGVRQPKLTGLRLRCLFADLRQWWFKPGAWSGTT